MIKILDFFFSSKKWYRKRFRNELWGYRALNTTLIDRILSMISNTPHIIISPNYGWMRMTTYIKKENKKGNKSVSISVLYTELAGIRHDNDDIQKAFDQEAINNKIKNRNVKIDNLI